MLARMVVLVLTLGLVLPADAQQTSGSQSPAISAAGNVSVLYGYTPEQLRELIVNADHAKQELADLQHRLGLTEGAALTVLHAVGQENVPPEQLARKLIEAADEYHAAVAQIAALKPENPATRALVDRTQAAITAGRFSEAHQLLREARAADIAGAYAARDIQEKARQAADAHLLEAAQSSAAEGNIAMTELHYLEAANHFQDAAELVPPGHPDDKGRFLLAEAGALQQQGDERGDNAALTKAISVYQLVENEYTRERVPLQWALTEMNLGNALAALGERESGTARLEQAVTAYQLALQENTRERVPLDWAYSEHGLANALALLAIRLNDPARMQEALMCMRNAAAVYREGSVGFWLPVAEQRITAMKAQLANMNKGRGSPRERSTGKAQEGQPQ